MMTPEHDDITIAAIATPPGAGGIGIIRISGPASLDILKTLFHPRLPQITFVSHKMYYGCIVNPDTRIPIDEALAVYMQAPHTYTREDVVEIHSHGSYLVLQDILAQVLSIGDTRLADPGEFTKRAFLNGRIDLTQAEAVIELLDAKTKEGLNMAMAQLQGSLYDRTITIRDSLVAVRAIIEVAIDFPEDDVEILHPQKLIEDIGAGTQAPLKELIASAEHGKIFREGVSVVILGRPNVGKSSLLNSLLQEERAIVTSVPGTTRDTIEEYLDIKGMPVRIVDTAGIREAGEAIEEIGIQRARQKLEGADLVLFMLDASEPLTSDDYSLYKSIKEKPVILVANKMDIADQKVLKKYEVSFPGWPLVAISAKEHEGLSSLESTIFDFVTGGTSQNDPGYKGVPNLRHKAALIKALSATEKVIEGLEQNLSPDLLAIELQSALDYLGDIVGVTTTEDVLDMIFEQFCIGK